MSLSCYLKERMGFLILHTIFFVIMVIMLQVSRTNGMSVLIVMGTMWYAPLGCYMVIEYLKYKRYAKEMSEVLDKLSPKYLLTEVMEAPPFEEGRMFYEVLQETLKEMHEEVNHYKWMQQDYKEYIEGWIHEIKTPIASAKLIISNNQNMITYKIEDELKSLEAYVEQVLYYARSADASKDYIIKAFDLRSVVMSCIKEQSRRLIQKRIMPQIEEFEEVVYSDAKWVSFICNQILYNSIQYSKDSGGSLIIGAKRETNKVVLRIQDTGIGINERDLKRVFDKGFTGENGRRFQKATGMGLYLCKKLCDKLGIGIGIQSEEGVGTGIYLSFPMDDTWRNLREKNDILQ